MARDFADVEADANDVELSAALSNRDACGHAGGAYLFSLSQVSAATLLRRPGTWSAPRCTGRLGCASTNKCERGFWHPLLFHWNLGRHLVEQTRL